MGAATVAGITIIKTLIQISLLFVVGYRSPDKIQLPLEGDHSMQAPRAGLCVAYRRDLVIDHRRASVGPFIRARLRLFPWDAEVRLVHDPDIVVEVRKVGADACKRVRRGGSDRTRGITSEDPSVVAVIGCRQSETRRKRRSAEVRPEGAGAVALIFDVVRLGRDPDQGERILGALTDLRDLDGTLRATSIVVDQVPVVTLLPRLPLHRTIAAYRATALMAVGPKVDLRIRARGAKSS